MNAPTLSSPGQRAISGPPAMGGDRPGGCSAWQRGRYRERVLLRDGRSVLVVCNFTPTVHHAYRVGVPRAGQWVERLNTDSVHYGGSNVGAPFGEITAQPRPAHGRPYSIELALPPLATKTGCCLM